MEIWRQLHPQLPGWQFWVLGDGPERSWMEAYCNEHGLDRVHFFGYDNPDSYYQKAKILHFTSAFEGFGNVLVEAQQNGVVPILFDSYSAASEIVWKNRNGVLIESFNVADYCTQTLALINDNAVLKMLASNAVEDVKRYSYEHIGLEWQDLFGRLDLKVQSVEKGYN